VIPLLFVVALAAQTPGDVKGWHGAEWGMTVEQIRAATGMTLEATTDGSGGECKSGTPGATLYRASAPIDVVTLSAVPRFCVTDKDGLVYINIDLGSNSVSYSRVRDELIGSYGRPTSEELGPSRPPIAVNNARWILPRTEIRVSSMRSMTGGDLDGLSVTYARRKPVL
jgi:hypothetical protein